MVDIETCTLPQLPADEYESTRDVDLLCVDVWKKTHMPGPAVSRVMVAYLFLFNNGKTEARIKKDGLWRSEDPCFDNYDDARRYLEAMILLGVENEPGA